MSRTVLVLGGKHAGKVMTLEGDHAPMHFPVIALDDDWSLSETYTLDQWAFPTEPPRRVWIGTPVGSDEATKTLLMQTHLYELLADELGLDK